MIQRIDLKTPLRFDGLEDSFPEELREGISALINRFNANWNSLYTDLTNQVVVDNSILPALQNGQASAGTLTSQTNKDVEQALILALMIAP